MDDSTHILTPHALAEGLASRRVGRRILVLPEVDSTNRYALALAAAEGPSSDGMVVFAEQQTAGRGRFGRSWHAPRGASLLMAVLLWEDWLKRGPAFSVMAAGLALLRGIEASTDVSPVIRWPNDLYVRNRKLAGVLVEVGEQGRVAAIGIGLNCLQQTGHFPEEIRDRSISLEMASSGTVHRPAVARAILHALDDEFGSSRGEDTARLAAEWSAHSDDIGRRTTLFSAGERVRGQIVDVHPETGLVLQGDNGVRRYFDPETTTRE